ncbi:MAG: deoxyribodipyrimidine photolyase [Hydrogenophaga sp.]|uniref:FAD-binding domain-containing protein n=1 Tax=Hydrogenophaga sp. TaxID=1904254 RepID=UPI002580361E|nr:FAD-binding domain-containing protein [Hydrogenophaga sp.]MBL0945137.1 deoxyribodipyrimidine photolyase [Hydrogenophaga sp.]
MSAPQPFEPTREAAHARLAALQPEAYARTRNHLEGAVTRLSPYLAHGLLGLAEVLQALRERHGLDETHKLVQELGWRAYFHHVWRHRGEAIFGSLHAGPLPDDAYAPALPEDIRRGATGVPAIDRAVRTLYATGYLHNHARLWLASYVVHLRKVHWRAGADWLYGHLLDGDLASNHLSWQWVAGTGSHKPYLFNADNVARFAPRDWHSAGSAIDLSYEALDALARRPREVGGGRGEPVDEPALHRTLPPGLATAAGPLPPAAALVHPWSLAGAPPGGAAVGVFFADFHARWPWSERRWRFVADRLQQIAGVPHWCEGPVPAGATAWADPHAAPWLAGARAVPVAAAFDEPARACASFTQYWRGTRMARGSSGARA